jgi:hypothetical protein
MSSLLLGLVLSLVVAACGGDEEPLAASAGQGGGVRDCISGSTSNSNDDPSAQAGERPVAYFPELAEQAQREGQGYFTNWHEEDEDDPNAVKVSFHFFKDAAAAQAAIDKAKASPDLREQIAPKVAERHRNLVMFRNRALSETQSQLIQDCLARFDAGKPDETVTLLDEEQIKSLQAEQQERDRRDKAASLAEQRTPELLAAEWYRGTRECGAGDQQGSGGRWNNGGLVQVSDETFVDELIAPKTTKSALRTEGAALLTARLNRTLGTGSSGYVLPYGWDMLYLPTPKLAEALRLEAEEEQGRGEWRGGATFVEGSTLILTGREFPAESLERLRECSRAGDALVQLRLEQTEG